MEVSHIQLHRCQIGRGRSTRPIPSTKSLVVMAGVAVLQVWGNAAHGQIAARLPGMQDHAGADPAVVREAAAPDLSIPVAGPRPSLAVRPISWSSAVNSQSPSANAQRSSAILPAQRPIGQVSIDIRPKSKAGVDTLPTDIAQHALQEIPFVMAAPPTTFGSPRTGVWARGAERVPYQPLYFEQVNVERYGRYHSRLQPACSALRFFATIPMLPYAMTLRNPHTAYYWDWPYEAGWGAPRVRELPPFEPRAAAVQATTATGLAFLVP